MEEQEILEQSEMTGQSKELPTFLKVLCILSWAWVAFGVFGSISTALKTQEEMTVEMDAAISQIELSPIASQPIGQETIVYLKTTVENSKSQNTVNLVLLLIEGVMVFLMFGRNKMGYWGYLLVQVGVITSVVYFSPWPNTVSNMTVGFSCFMSLLFAILYAVNLKHMR